jgi:hypothetical protein
LILLAVLLATVVTLDRISASDSAHSGQISTAVVQSPTPAAGEPAPEAFVLYFPFPLSSQPAPIRVAALSTAAPTQTPLPTSTDTLQTSPTLGPDDWKNLPVVPAISKTAIEIYQKGLALGNNPKAFSKVGDCNSLSVRFLTYFDGDPGTYYNLESHTDLQPVIDQFSGSFKRVSQAVGDGFNTSTVLAPFRADPYTCKGGESPLACELRLHKPSFVFIAIGTDDYLTPAKFEASLRQVLDTAIKLGVVPILATKADNINQLNYNPIIARVAQEYDIPLWNLWRALNPLPGGGLEDNEHPSGTFAAFDFSPDNLSKYGWPMRNLTALEVLNAVWRGVTQQ